MIGVACNMAPMLWATTIMSLTSELLLNIVSKAIR